MRRLFVFFISVAALYGCSDVITCDEATVGAGELEILFGGRYFRNFDLSGEAFLTDGASSGIMFHVCGHQDSGYEVLFHNGPVDGTRKTGSLSSVRNLYRSLGQDGEWFPFELAVRGRNISVKVRGVDVVCYTEPDSPYRSEEHAGQMLGRGRFVLAGHDGISRFRNLKVEVLDRSCVNPCDTLPPVDERTDEIIRLQQADFPVIDWHVHCKGGLTFDMAHALSMNYGINYGVGPNAYGPMKPGEGGYGTMYMGNDDLGAYYESVMNEPFLLGVQGEGRKWPKSFSADVLGRFDYLYTDSMTIFDPKDRLTRTYRPEEVIMDVTEEEYMDRIVDQTVRIFSNEPADIYANAFFIPDVLSDRFDEFWTDERVDRVLDVLAARGIALEISARYRIPSRHIIERAKARGIRFTFGTNNMGVMEPGFQKLEYCLEMVRECGLAVEDLWFPER